MKNKFMATAAIVAILAATGAARAETTDLATLKAQSAALKKQNAALEARLNRLEKNQAKQEKKIDSKVAVAPAGQPAPESYLGLVTKGPIEAITDDGPICWKGVCVVGGIDVGLNYATHGAPLSDKYYNGNEMATKPDGRSIFGLNPNGLQNSTIGLKGSTEILPGISGVFTATTLFNPQSGQLQNAQGSLVAQQGVPLNQQQQNADGSRGGQAFNDQLNAGVSSKEFGTLTAGRHRNLSTDLVGAYDATGGAPAFSLIGYSGTYVTGSAFTGNGRWDDSLKYKIEYGPARFAAMYKFRDGNGGTNIGNTQTYVGGTTQSYSAKNDAGQVDLGFSYAGFDIDGVLGYFHQAISSAALSTTQLGGTSVFTPNAGAATTTTGNNNSGTLAGTVADATNFDIAAKYTWNQLKFYAGWAHIILHNPKNNVGIGGEAAQGGYLLSTVNNAAYPHARLIDTEWGGVRYAFDPKTDLIAQYVHVSTNGYGTTANLATCGLAAINRTTLAAPRSATCSGNINQIGGFVDYHFSKRFDVYGGVSYSVFQGGFASGYLYPTDFSPTVGVRYVF